MIAHRKTGFLQQHGGKTYKDGTGRNVVGQQILENQISHCIVAQRPTKGTVSRNLKYWQVDSKNTTGTGRHYLLVRVAQTVISSR